MQRRENWKPFNWNLIIKWLNWNQHAIWLTDCVEPLSLCVCVCVRGILSLSLGNKKKRIPLSLYCTNESPLRSTLFLLETRCVLRARFWPKCYLCVKILLKRSISLALSFSLSFSLPAHLTRPSSFIFMPPSSLTFRSFLQSQLEIASYWSTVDERPKLCGLREYCIGRNVRYMAFYTINDD